MAADQARAERLKALKLARPDVTWGQLADEVGVTERSVAEWAKTGQMSYGNAKKVAAFFKADRDWFWRGPEAESPDLMGVLSPDVSARLDQLAQI